MLHRASVQSTTAAAADVKRAAQRREPSRAAAVEKLAARGPLAGQCGVVVAHGPWVASMDLFGSPHLLAAHWRALIRSHLLEPPVAKGRPSATRVLQVVRRFAAARTQEAPGVGLGIEQRARFSGTDFQPGRGEEQDFRAGGPLRQLCTPPQTLIVCPVTKLEASEARKSAAVAISSGSPILPNGLRLSRSFRISGSLKMGRAMSVHTNPGAIELIRTLCRPKSQARHWVSMMTPAFATL